MFISWLGQEQIVFFITTLIDGITMHMSAVPHLIVLQRCLLVVCIYVFSFISRDGFNIVTGQIWSAGRQLPTPAIYRSKILLASDNSDFSPKSQYILWTLKLSCFLFVTICFRQDRHLSKWKTKYIMWYSCGTGDVLS